MAHQRQIRKLAELRALSQGLAVTDVEEEAKTNLLKVEVQDFLEEVKLTKQDKTWGGYQIHRDPMTPVGWSPPFGETGRATNDF
jgi:hypothetical protein